MKFRHSRMRALVAALLVAATTSFAPPSARSSAAPRAPPRMPPTTTTALSANAKSLAAAKKAAAKKKAEDLGGSDDDEDNSFAAKLGRAARPFYFVGPLLFLGQILFLVSTNLVSGLDNLDEYGRLGNAYIRENTNYETMNIWKRYEIQTQGQQIWYDNVFRDLENGGPVKPPISTFIKK